jgi:hypothetical protein
MEMKDRVPLIFPTFSYLMAQAFFPALSGHKKRLRDAVLSGRECIGVRAWHFSSFWKLTG